MLKINFKFLNKLPNYQKMEGTYIEVLENNFSLSQYLFSEASSAAGAYFVFRQYLGK